MTTLQMVGFMMSCTGGLLVGYSGGNPFVIIIASQMVFWGIMLAGEVVT